jgi:hypothetical protein
MVRNLITVAAALTENRLARHGRAAAGKVAIVAGAAFIASLSAFAAIGCALWALWVYALPHAGPVGAPLIVSAVLLAVCIGALAAARQSLRPRPRRSIHAQALSGASLSHEASALFKDQKSALLLGALLAGVVAGSNRK